MNQIPWDRIQLGTIEWVVLGSLALLFLTGILFQRTRQQAPAMMTSIGILGTFAGIYVAMLPLDFSPLNMNDSVRELVNGMKTAFLTSLMGLAAAILFRVTIALGWHRKATSSSTDDGVLSALSDIRTAIAGEDDASLTNQIGRLRLDVTERLDRLRVIQDDGFGQLNALTETIHEALVENLQKLIAELHESVGKELRESLNRLIQDIEKALIEQFGSTFVEFNEATQALKKWQHDHRDQVEQLTEAFNIAANGIEAIARNCERIPRTMDLLAEGVSAAREDVEALNRRLEAFASLRERAEQSFPTIKQHLDAIGENLRESAAGFNDMGKKIENAFQEAQASAMRTMQTHSADVKEMVASMKGDLEEAQRGALNIIKEDMEAFSQDVQIELKRITRDWGGNMIAIAAQCQEVIDSVRSEPRR